MKKILTIIGLAALTLAGANAAALVWDEVYSNDFSSLALGTSITNSVGGATYTGLATSTPAGTLSVAALDSGKGAKFTSNSASATYFAVTGLALGDVGKLTFDINVTTMSSTSGQGLYIYLGQDTGMNAGTLANANRAATVRVGPNGQVAYQKGTYGTGGSTSYTTLGAANNMSLTGTQSIELVYNLSGADILYSGVTIANGCYILTLNGTVLTNPDTSTSNFVMTRDQVTGNIVDITAFRIESQGSDFTIGNIKMYSGSPIPEPSTWLLLGVGVTAVAIFRRRK